MLQVNNSDNGTGLGLSLVKKMCEGMDIDITFSSEVDKGSVFRLTLTSV
jgi:signal transduction histidine kinase